MGSEETRVGTRVRVRSDHRIESRRGAMGRIVRRYGGRKYVAVEVRLADGRCRLFWPEDLKAASTRLHRWRPLFDGR